VVANAIVAIQLEAEPFEPLHALAEWHKLLAAGLGMLPAAESHFVGRVRPSGANDAPLTALELEHYPGMTEACIASLAAAAAGRHRATAVLVRHRIGLVLPGDAIVLVAIGFSLIVVVIAALNLVLDFDFIEQAAERGAPKYLEWYGAFALMVTLVWLYMEILRLLSKLRSRN
jgi:molybdopterin synthase catalytic subunit